MSSANIGKRQMEDGSSTAEWSKKSRIEKSKRCGKFTEDCIPAEIFPIGGDVFVTVNIFYESVSVHIRQFKKYGKTYYPSNVGITLVPWWIDYIMGKKKVPESYKELPKSPFPPEKHLQISSENFKYFTFKRINYDFDQVSSSKEIVLSREQWNQMILNYQAILQCVLDRMFQCMDLLKAFKLQCDGPIENALPSALDLSIGQNHLVQILKKSICHLLLEKGLKEPEMVAEELWGNRVETFNELALTLNPDEIANQFYEYLHDTESFLLLKPINYVTLDFFKNLKLNIVLNEVRDNLCPTDCFEYFEDYV